MKLLAIAIALLGVSASFSFAADQPDVSSDTVIVTPLPGAAADLASKLPTVRDLGCEVRCSDIDGPVRLKVPPIHYDPNLPQSDDPNYYAEGSVALKFLIKADGHVGDVVVVQVVGPQTYADLAKAEVMDRIYEPAKLKGKAIDREFEEEIEFKNAHAMTVRPPVRQAITDVLQDSEKLLNDNKLDEAEAMLRSSEDQPSLAFTERAELANQRAIVALKHGDYAKARRLLGWPVYHVMTTATAHNMDTLTSHSDGMLLRSRLQAALAAGDIDDALFVKFIRDRQEFSFYEPLLYDVDTLKAKVDAAQTFTTDREIPPADDSDGFALGSYWSSALRVNTTLKSKPGFPTGAEIPSDGQGDASAVSLYWRAFSVRNIVGGTLDKILMRCKQHTVETDVSQAVKWQVPKDWGDCFLIGRGTPGTKFQLVQYAN